MDELPDLLVIIFPNSKIAGNTTLCRLVSVINYGLKRYFLEKCMVLVKNANHFTVLQYCSGEK